MQEPGDWRDTFCGRKEELHALVRRFEEVAAGQGPRLAVVLGDRGMGKTRLVQEFYRVLATRFDPQDYWPDASLFAGNNLRVAPELSDAAVRAHYASFTLTSRPMPFLWWGFRLSDPDVRNAARSDLASHRATLELHLKPVHFAREVMDARTRLRHAGVDAASELGKNLLKAAVQAIPGAAVAATVVDAALDYGGKAWAARKARHEEANLRASHDQVNLLHADSEREVDLHERTLDELAAVLAPNGDSPPLPVVVFCDDAQFSGVDGDEGARRLLTELWDRAHLAGWPLFLVLTHWALDWHRARPGDASLAGALARDARSAQFGLLLDLPKETTLGELVLAGLPGLAEDDVQLLIGKADGNPQVLIELVGLVRRSPAWRQRGGGPLTLHARREIERRPTELAKLILERLESDVTPEAVRQAVALSSVQGMEFLRLLTDLASKALQLGGASESLADAEYPHRLIVGIESGVAGFVQRAYREAAGQLIGGHLGDPKDVDRCLLEAALALVNDADQWALLAQGEQAAAWGVLIGLAQDSPDASIRVYAGRGLLWLIAAALSSERGADSARAAELAVRFEQGLQSRWALADFPTEDVLPALRALSLWHGAARTTELADQLVQHARAQADARGTDESRESLSARLEHAGSAAEARSDWAAAADFYRESMNIRRQLADTARTPESRLELARVVLLIGDVENVGGGWRNADMRFEEGLQILRDVVAQSDLPEFWPALAQALQRVGAAALERGDLQAADRAYQEELAITRRLVALQETPKRQRDLALAIYSMGLVAKKRGDWPSAESMYQECLEILRKLADRLDTPASMRDVASALSEIGEIAQVRGDLAGASSAVQESLNISRQLADRLGTAASRRDLAVALFRVGALALAEERLDDAEAAYGECHVICRELAERIGTPGDQQQLAAALWGCAVAAQRKSDWGRADALHGERLTLSRRLHDQLGTPASQSELASALTYMGQVAQVLGDLERAMEFYRESNGIYRDLAERLATPASLDDLASLLSLVAVVTRAQGDWDAADAADREGLDIRRRLAAEVDTPESHGKVARSLSSIGETARARGRWDEAEAAYAESQVIFQELVKRFPSLDFEEALATGLIDLAGVARARENWSEVHRLYRESLAIRRRLHDKLGTYDALRDVAVPVYYLGELAQSQGNLMDAEALYRECLGICQDVAAHVDLPESRRDLSVTLRRLGEVLQARGDLSGAEAAYRQSLDIVEELAPLLRTPVAHCDVAESLRLMASIAFDKGQLADAKHTLEDAYQRFDQHRHFLDAQTADSEARAFESLAERVRKAALASAAGAPPAS